MNKKIAYLGLFTAVAIIFGYIEMCIPIFVGIPGMKLGLANLISVFLLYLYSWKETAFVAFIRILVIGFLFGNLFSILFSCAGAAVSLLVMMLVKKIPDFSVIGVSIAGGVAHNIAQVFVAAMVVESKKMFYYLPFLLVAGLVTGMLIGIVSKKLLYHLQPIMKKNGQGTL